MAIAKELFPTVGSSAAAAVNTALIQSFLDDGGGIIGGEGDVFINDTLLVGDNCKLITAPGTTLKLAPSSNTIMVATAQHAVSASAVTVTWSAGKIVSIAWTDHGLAVGDAIVLQGEDGTTAAQWWTTARVTTVTDEDTVVAVVPFQPTASPSGNVTAKRCNRNITVDAELDFNSASNGGGTAIDRVMSVWSFVSDSNIKVRGRDGVKFIAMLAGAISTQLEGIALGGANSDVVKVYGPSTAVSVRSVGMGPEDTISIQAYEPDTFIAYMPCKGNIRGVTVRESLGVSYSGGSGASIVYADPTFVIEGVVLASSDFTGIGNVSSTGVNGLKLVNGRSPGSGGDNLRDVTVRDCTLGADEVSNVVIDTKLHSLTFKTVKFVAPASASHRLVNVLSSQGVDQLVFEDCDLYFGTWPATLGYLVSVNGNAYANTIIFRRCRIRAGSALRCILVANTATVQNIVFDDCDVASVDQMAQISATPTVMPNVTFRGGKYSGVLCGVSVAADGCKVFAGGGAYFYNMSNGLVRPSGSGVNVELYDHGMELDGTSVPFSCQSSATVDLKGPNIRADIGATGVKKTAGNMCFNTGSGRGTVPQNVTVGCDGTNWFNLADPTEVY